MREPEDEPVRWCDLHMLRLRGQDELGDFRGSWGGQEGDGWRVVESETEGQKGPLDPVKSQ